MRSFLARHRVALACVVVAGSLFGLFWAASRLGGWRLTHRLDRAAQEAAAACSAAWRATMLADGAALNDPDRFEALRSQASAAGVAQGRARFLAVADPVISLASGSPQLRAVPQIGAHGGPGVSCAASYRIASGRQDAQSGELTAATELPPFAQVYLILDTSASMMVGATPDDQGKIAHWVAAHADRVLTKIDQSPCAFACHDRESGPLSVSDLQQGEAVAHEVGATTRFDWMKRALANDPAQQRFCGGSDQIPCDFDELEGLLAHIRDKYGSTQALATFSYSLFGFNEGIGGDEPAETALVQDVPDLSQYAVTSRTEVPDIAMAVNRLTIGLDTHLNPPVIGSNAAGKPHVAVLPALVDLVGPTRPDAGAAPGNALKFVIIVTDGLSSDRTWNWGGRLAALNRAHITGEAHPPPLPLMEYCRLWAGPAPVEHGRLLWQGGGSPSGECNNLGYGPSFWDGAAEPSRPYSGVNNVYYAQPLDPGYCARMKDNSGKPGPGVTVAVVETPYVPMNGQDPAFYPYEATVQRVIYPDGNPATHPGGGSTLSTALRACASSPDYYFRAGEDSAITTGLVSLFDQFVAEHAPRPGS